MRKYRYSELMHRIALRQLESRTPITDKVREYLVLFARDLLRQYKRRIKKRPPLRGEVGG